MQKGYEVSSKDTKLYIRKGDDVIHFDRKLKAGKDGLLIGVKMIPRPESKDNPLNKSNESNVDNEREEPVQQRVENNEQQSKEINVMMMHQRLGHCHEDVARKTSKRLGIKLTGAWKVCKDCCIGKAKQQNLNKSTENKMTKKGARLHLDLSSVKKASLNGTKHWGLVVDEATNFAYSCFLKKKDELGDKVLDYIFHL